MDTSKAVCISCICVFFFFKSLNTFTELSRDSFDYCFTFVQTE